MSSTSRRTLLAAVSTLAGSAGCLGRAFLSNPVPPEEYERSVSLKKVDSVPDEYGAEFEIEVSHADITAEQSAVLRTRVTNTNEEERQFSTPYYKGASSYDGKRGIILYSKIAADNPANQPRDLQNYAPPCVGTDGKSRGKLVWSNEAQPMPTLAPDETWTDDLLVADDPTHRGCLPVGEYRFERRIESMWMDEGFDWGFSLEVTS
ncbi:hypothetical protein [Haladaptatus sp. NG-SE-30]